MKLLAIDTSTDRATLALRVDQQIFSSEQVGVKQHAQLLLPQIDNLLQQHAVALPELDGIVFGQGPGSFTGLRIACSVAKAIAYGHDLPMYPVSTLAAIAQSVRCQEKSGTPILAVLDARMQEVYWSEFSEGSDANAHVSSMSAIQIATKEPLVLAGVGFEPYLSVLPPDIIKQITRYITVYPEAKHMIEIVLEGKIQHVSAEDALPIYIRDDVTHK